MFGADPGSAPRPSQRSHGSSKRTVTVFHEGLAWVAQISMFVALGLLVFPSKLGDVAVEGTVLALVLVFVARPIATFVSTAFDRFENSLELFEDLGDDEQVAECLGNLAYCAAQIGRFETATAYGRRAPTRRPFFMISSLP